MKYVNTKHIEIDVVVTIHETKLTVANLNVFYLYVLNNITKFGLNA